VNADPPSEPRIVATVTTEDDLAFLATASRPPADLLEFRLDQLGAHRDAVARCLERPPAPVLLTVRSPAEGGAGNLDDDRRLALYGAFRAHATLVDTEIDSLERPDFAGFVAESRRAGATVVGSFHDFEAFPGAEVISARIDRAFDLGVDIAKVAVVLEEMRELFALVDIVERARGDGLLVAAMGMGPLGKLSRLVLARAGSCLNYGYLRTPNAPGQWSAEELARLIAELAV